MTAVAPQPRDSLSESGSLSKRSSSLNGLHVAALLSATKHATGPFRILTPPSEAKMYRYRPLWRRALFKIKVRAALQKVNQDILVYGTTNELTDLNHQYKINIDQLIEKKAQKLDDFRKFTSDVYDESLKYSCLLHPDSLFKKVWNVLMVLLLMYTAFIVPYRIAFEEQVFWDAWTMMDLGLDGFFMLDVGINFFSIGVNEDGSLEARRGVIAKSYLKTWFLVDISSCFPMTLVDYFSNPNPSSTTHTKYNSLLKVSRLPRMYKILRIVRVIKLLKAYTNNPAFERFQDFLQINSRRG
jgi:hypothetical protein